MLNSLLNAVESVDSLILNVFIILGVVIASSIVLYFLCEAILALTKKEKTENKLVFDEVQKKDEPKETAKQNKNVVVENYSLDGASNVAEVEETAEQEVVEEQETPSILDENNLIEVDEQKAKEEQSEAEAEQERENAERRAYLEARRQEIANRMREESAEEETENVSENNEEVNAAAQQLEEERSVLAAEREKIAAERSKYETMMKELEEAKKTLAEQQAKTKTVTITRLKNGALSLEELKERLEASEEKLRENEKDLRKCKKEYIPLRRVWMTHERDENKLRRKEAMVAKQKVVLYGVNNYADIDEEKAKKLSEDLDLLDGLKLSVQHCEEVMEKNAERYPVLEKMFNVLKSRNEEIKADVEYYKSEIEKLEQNGENGGEQTTVEVTEEVNSEAQDQATQEDNDSNN